MGVCEGYANLMKALCKVAEIKCWVIPGYTKWGNNYKQNDPVPRKFNHVWNIVELDDGEKFVCDSFLAAG